MTSPSARVSTDDAETEVRKSRHQGDDDLERVKLISDAIL